MGLKKGINGILYGLKRSVKESLEGLVITAVLLVLRAFLPQYSTQLSLAMLIVTILFLIRIANWTLPYFIGWTFGLCLLWNAGVIHTGELLLQTIVPLGMRYRKELYEWISRIGR